MKEKILLSLSVVVLGILFFNSSVASAATNNKYSVNNTIRQAPNTGDASGGWGITPGHTHWG